MTIVIQDVETRRCYAGDDDWVMEPREALPFHDARHAVQFCRRYRFRNVRLLALLRDNKVSLLMYVPGSDIPTTAGMMHATAE
jgi:hypothetical protein